MPRIELSSVLYGTEYFTYPTMREAKGGFRRLIACSKKQAAKDGEARRVRLGNDERLIEPGATGKPMARRLK